jgi:hypothetical protein
VADENQTDPEFKPDVPETGVSIVKHEEARALARRIAGEEAPNECRFHCITCGWNETLQFKEEEILALGGDITAYSAPCPDCNAMTMVPYASLMGEDVATVYQKAKANRLAEVEEQAEANAGALVNRIKGEMSGIMGGSAFSPTPEEEHDPANVHDPRPVHEREDLPSADSVNIDDLKPRSE